MANKQSRAKPLSLYPLKFDDVISDVLKVKPEPRERLPKRQAPSRKQGNRQRER